MTASIAYYNLPVLFAINNGEQISSIRKLFYPFHIDMWLGLLILFIVGYFIILLLQSFEYYLIESIKNNLLFFNMINIFLGGSMHRIDSSTFLRILLGIWFLVCVIIRTSYQGSLFNFLQSNKHIIQLDTIDKVLESDYNIYLIPSFLHQIEPFMKNKKRYNII